MSTPALPVVSAVPHPLWYARAASWLLGIGKHVKSGILKVATTAPKVDAVLREYAPTIEGISNLLIPGSGNFEAHLLDSWSVLAHAVKTAGDAASANGVNFTLDAALVAEIRSFLPAVEAFLHPASSPVSPTK